MMEMDISVGGPSTCDINTNVDQVDGDIAQACGGGKQLLNNYLNISHDHVYSETGVEMMMRPN